jgi:hypothetical protein
MGRSSKSPTVAAKKPLAVWKKPVKLQPVKFASAFARGIYDAATGGWKDLGGDRPGELSVLRDIAEPLTDWLHAHGASEAEARSLQGANLQGANL